MGWWGGGYPLGPRAPSEASMGSAVRLCRHIVDHHMDLLDVPLQRVDRSAQSAGNVLEAIE